MGSFSESPLEPRTEVSSTFKQAFIHLLLFTCFVQMWGIFILFSYKFILLGRVCFLKKTKWEFKFLLFGLISESSAHGRDTD